MRSSTVSGVILLFIYSHNMEIESLLTWDVGQHDDDEAVVVVKGHVILVGEPHGVHSRSAYKRQGSINGHQFPDDPQGVQHDEEVVPGKERM